MDFKIRYVKFKERLNKWTSLGHQKIKPLYNRIKLSINNTKESELLAKGQDGLAVAVHQLSILLNAALATQWVKGLEEWFTRFNISKDIYDKAIDANFHIGGSRFHHLVDGNHTILGAVKAAVEASPNDSNLTAIFNAFEHLFRDMCSKSGISPFLHVTKDQLDQIAAFTHLPKTWLNDFLTFNSAEVLGAAVAVLAVVFSWGKSECGRFAEYAGTFGITSIISANPLLGLISLVCLAKAFVMVNQKENIKEKKHEIMESLTKGTVTPSIVIAISGILGGPAYIGVVVGIIVAIIVRKKIDDKEFMTQIKTYLEKQYEEIVKPTLAELQDNLKSTIESVAVRIKVHAPLKSIPSFKKAA